MYKDFAPCQEDDPRADCQPQDERHPERIYIPPASELSRNKRIWKNKDESKRFQEMEEAYVMHFKIPSDLQCDACTLQWWWSSAHQSCLPDEDYLHYFGDTFKKAGWTQPEKWIGYWAHQSEITNPNSPRRCRDNNLGEEWTNCADIAVKGHAGPPDPSLHRRRRTATKPPITTTTTTAAAPSGRRRRQNQDSRRRNRSRRRSRQRRRRASRRRRRGSPRRRKRTNSSNMKVNSLESALRSAEHEEEQVYKALKEEEQLRTALSNSMSASDGLP